MKSSLRIEASLRKEPRGQESVLFCGNRSAPQNWETDKRKNHWKFCNFTVELKAIELADRSVRFGMLTKTLGGGYFLLNSLKLREALEKSEKEVWICVDDKVAELTGSAQKAQRSSS